MAKKRSWKLIVSIVAIAVCIALAFWYFKLRKDGAPEYQTIAVTRGDITQLVTATGQLNPVTNVQVGCQISGTIDTLYVDFNSPVTNGQIVARLDPGTYNAIYNQTKGDLANAEAAAELAQVNARRSKELFDAKLIPQSDYDQAIATLHQAEATVMVKKASAQKAAVDLERCTIYSPVDGMVISRSVDVGQTVAASLNAPTLFVIANDLTKMQIDANVAEGDVGGVEVNQVVDFTVDAFPNRTFHGKVLQVRNSPLTVQNVVTYDTVVGVNNPDLKLKPGMTANVSIIIAERSDALRIPNAALRFRPPEASTNATPRSAGGGGGQRPGGGGGYGQRSRGENRQTRTVYLLKDDKLQATQIKIGITDGIYTEVTDGLAESDKVVTALLSKSGGPASQATNPFGGMRRF